MICFQAVLRWLAVVGLFFLSSCDFLQEGLQVPRSYRIRAAEFPPAWLQQSGLRWRGWLWHIDMVRSHYADSGYTLEQKEFYSTASDLNIKLKKQQSALVLLYPVFAHFPDATADETADATALRAKLWRPAGATLLWQEHSADKNHRRYQLSASWEEGFRSLVLSSLIEGGFDLRYFNSVKLKYYLSRRLRKQTTDFLPNYWDYDHAYLIAEIARLDADWYDIRRRQAAVSFGLPSGNWQALNVAEPALRCTAPCAPTLNVGQQYFLELKTMRLWHTEVAQDGEVLALLLEDI